MVKKGKFFRNTASKCSLIHKGLPALFPCLTKKLHFFNSATSILGKFLLFWCVKAKQGLSPCKTDKPKNRKFNNIEAYCVRAPNAYLIVPYFILKCKLFLKKFHFRHLFFYSDKISLIVLKSDSEKVSPRAISGRPAFFKIPSASVLEIPNVFIMQF